MCVCVCLCVCAVRALTLESFDVETSVLVIRYSFRISRLSSYIKVMGSRSRSQEQKVKRVYVHILVGGLPSAEWQSCSRYLSVFCYKIVCLHTVEMARNEIGLYVFCLRLYSMCNCAILHYTSVLS